MGRKPSRFLTRSLPPGARRAGLHQTKNHPNVARSSPTDGATNNGIADFLNNLVALRDALNGGVTSAVTAAQTPLAASEDLLVSTIADNGGVQTRIEASQSQQTDRTTSLDSLISSETEADLPSTIVKLSQTQTAYQAALQSAANIMRLSLLDYLK